MTTLVSIAQGGSGANNAADARSALGAVALAGDTMTGNLVMSGATVNTATANITTIITGNNLTLSTGAASNGNIVFSSNGTEDIRIVANGFVSVGTTSPTTRLTVGDGSHGIGFSYLESASLPSIAGLFTDAATGQTGYGSLLVKARTDFGGFYSINFFTSASNNTPVERLRITSGGNVGIATTSPDARLHVVGNIYTQNSGADTKVDIIAPTDSFATYLRWGVSGIRNSGILGFPAGSADLVFRNGGDTFSNGTERFRITSGGSVGVGTNPATQLHIYNNGASVVRAEGVAFSSAIRASLQASDGGAVFVGAETNHRLGFLSNNIERLYIATSGALVQPSIAVGNLASNSISEISAIGSMTYSFSIQGDNNWRTLVSNFNDRQGVFYISLSDAASGDIAAFSYDTTSPAYGVAAVSQIFYHDGGWNTGTFGVQLVNAGGNLYALQVRYQSYYSSSNLGGGYVYFISL